MPLINGQKMACEPCIRGHRSTKCTHANERLMVPVRKPGRPLSTCPHPASRPCSCAAVTAAIPRKQKCSCGTPGPVSTGINNDEGGHELPSVAGTPSSPSKPVNSFRVQKQPSKSGSGRKQSIDPMGLKRMDANQINILPTYEAMPRTQAGLLSGHVNSLVSVPTYETLDLVEADNSVNSHSTLFSMFQHSSPSPLMHTIVNKSARKNGHTLTLSNDSTKPPVSTLENCCTNIGQFSTPPRTIGHKSATVFNPAEADEKRGGCCSSATVDLTETKEEGGVAPGLPPLLNGVMMPPFPAPVGVASGIYPYFPQQTVFAYPPQYGSYLQPLQPDQWKHVMSMFNPGHPAPTNSTFGVPGSLPFQQTPSSNAASWTSHRCSCGDSCQCIGCAAHPYNDATQEYVRSAWNTMAEDAQAIPDSINGNHVPSGDHCDRGGQKSEPSNRTVSHAHKSGEGTASPTAPQTPSDVASGVSDEQALPESDFFFVSYPFADSCAGVTANCPCGDDCQCIGCAIHNNPGNTERVSE